MPEKPGPLQSLVIQLAYRGVPSLSVLLGEIAGAEDYAEFRRLIAEFLPEREGDILHEPTPQLQMERFTSYFTDRYFPLEDGMGFEGYGELTSRIPLPVMGFTYDDYHELPSEFKASFQLMSYLITNPYEDEVDVALAEGCEEHVPRELLERVVGNRLDPNAAHQILNGTRYEGLATWADWIHHATGNFFLDTDYEELWNNVPFEWDRDTVERLNREWHQAEELQNRINNFANWLEEDLVTRFEEVLNFIIEKRENG
jgi:hypothetical protein